MDPSGYCHRKSGVARRFLDSRLARLHLAKLFLLGFALLVLIACLARRLVRGRFAPASLSSLRVVRLPRSRYASPFSFAPRLPACRSLPGFRLFVNSRFSFAPCTLKTAQVFESRDFSLRPLASARPTLWLAFAFCMFPCLQNDLTGCGSLSLLLSFHFALLPACIISSFSDQALDRLVSSSCIRCRTSTDDLSTSSSLRGLTHF